LGHLGRPRRAAVAAHVDHVHVVAALRDVLHPRDAAERQVELISAGYVEPCT
jgi:hypothetical protein